MVDHRRTPEPPPGLGVVPTLGTAAGHPVVVPVTVTNRGPAPRIISVAALGIDPSWLPDPARTAPLAPGASAIVQLTLSPEIGTYPAQYPLVISAQSLEPETGAPAAAPPGLAETTLTVNPRTQLSLRLQPAETSTIVSKRFSVMVRNSGAEAARIRLVVQTSHNLRIRLRRDQVEVGPGETVRVRARARVRKPRLFGWIGRHQFTVTATGSESIRHVEGSIAQRPVMPPAGAKILAIVSVMAIWLGAAVVFIPQFGDWIRDSALEANRAAGPRNITETEDAEAGAKGGESGEGAEGGAGGADGGGDGGEDGGGGADGGGDGAVVPASARGEVQLSGTVQSDQPQGVQVRLEPTSLVDEEAQGGTGVGIPDDALRGNGMRMMSAFTQISTRRAQPDRSATTTSDGTWAFPAVRSPGYYLLTFTKPGYQTQKYVVDSSTEIAKEPLEVSLLSGEGRLSGRITGPSGPVGGAEIVISDGTNTVTTNSTSRGKIGTWAIEGLSTPGAYVIQASKHAMSSEARQVRLGAGGSATADLALVNGVATLTGEVRRTTAAGKQRGMGGATVTVADGAGETRTATTLTEGRIGWYTLPGLPAPGSYSVTISGDGFQAQTSRLVLKRGQSRASRSVDLTSGSGILSGRVMAPGRVGLEGAGLVLTNAENTYKTTSISSPKGGYSFTGVTPGSYTLSTQMFGLVTDHVTVNIRSGRTTELNRILGAQEGGVVPTRSKIVGSVVDFSTGLPVRACLPTHPNAPRCVTATVEDAEPVQGTNEPTSVTYRTNFEPSEQYTLPEIGAKGGLRAGLHTVRITAPGYEPAEIDIEVPHDTVVNAPVVELQPVPKVQGTISAVVGQPNSKSCVWVVAGPASGAEPTFPDCQDAIAAGVDNDPSVSVEQKCMPLAATYEATEADIARTCAATDDNGNYSVEVPTAGIYTVYVVPSDPEYVTPTRTQLNLTRASTTNHNVALDRYARVKLRVLTPGSGETLVASGDTPVEVDPAPLLPHGLTDTSTGEVLIRGLRPGVHTFSATDPQNPDQSGSVTQAVGHNQEVELRLALIEPVPSLVGRVWSEVFTADEPRPQATVVMDVPYAFGSDDRALYATVNLTTNGQGCFAVRSADDPPVTTECGTINPPARVSQTVLSNRVRSVYITAPGYEPLTVENVQFSGVEPFQLKPARINFAASVSVNPAPATAPDWSSATVSVSQRPAGTGVISAGATQQGSSLSVANLTWAEAGQPAGTARPGDYQVRVSLAGYEPATRTLRCVPGGSCAFTSALVLDRLGSVTVRTVSSLGGTPVNGAIVTRRLGAVDQGPAVTASGGNSVTFTGVTPGTDPTHNINVRAAGHAFGHSPFPGSPSTDVVLSCDKGPDPTKITVEIGEETLCTATLRRLGSISGTLVGVRAPQGQSGTEIALSQVDVTAARCTDGAACTEVSATERFTATTRVDDPGTPADEGGTFSITGTNGTAGLRTGSWRVTASNPNFDPPSTPLVVTVTEGADTANTVVRLYSTPVVLLVELEDNYGATVTDATVRLGVTSTGGPVGEVVGSGASTRYRFTGVIPNVDQRIWVSGPGLISTDVAFRAEPISVGPQPQTRKIDVSRAQGTLNGVVSSADGAIDGATVTLFCTTTGTPACPAGDPALGTNNQPLVRTTDNLGRYDFNNIPLGSYSVVFAAEGYVDPATPPLVGFTTPDSRTQDRVLTSVQWPVELTLTTSHPDQPLAGATIKLVPEPGNPATEQTFAAPSGGSGTWTTSLSQVRWGCYRVEVTLPTGQFGTIGTLTGSPSGLGCASGALTVPRTAPTGDESVEVSRAISSGQLQVDLTLDPWPGHDAPGVNLAINQTSGGSFTRTVTAVGQTTLLWVPPGNYSITPTVTGLPAWSWPTSAQTTSVNGTTGIATVPIALVEATKAVTIVIPGAVAGEVPNLTITAENGHGDPPVIPAFTGGTVTVDLPRGPWLIEAGSIAGGPSTGFIEVTNANPQTVTLTPTIPETP